MKKYTLNSRSRPDFRQHINLALKNKLLFFAVTTVFLLLAVFILAFQKDSWLRQWLDGAATEPQVERIRDLSAALINPIDIKYKTKACDRVNLDKLAGNLGVSFTNMGGITPDKKTGNKSSSCVVISKDRPKLMVLFLLREKDSVDDAKQSLTALSKDFSMERLDGLDGDAVFSSSSNQLTLQKGKEIWTISVNSIKEGFNNKEAVILATQSVNIK